MRMIELENVMQDAREQLRKHQPNKQACVLLSENVPRTAGTREPKITTRLALPADLVNMRLTLSHVKQEILNIHNALLFDFQVHDLQSHLSKLSDIEKNVLTFLDRNKFRDREIGRELATIRKLVDNVVRISACRMKLGNIRNEYSGQGSVRGRQRRRKLESDDSVAELKAWYLTNAAHPYPSKEEKIKLAQASGLTLEFVTRWFINVRCRSEIGMPAVEL
jgi:Homeobox KN domain